MEQEELVPTTDPTLSGLISQANTSVFFPAGYELKSIHNESNVDAALCDAYFVTAAGGTSIATDAGQEPTI